MPVITGLYGYRMATEFQYPKQTRTHTYRIRRLKNKWGKKKKIFGIKMPHTQCSRCLMGRAMGWGITLKDGGTQAKGDADGGRKPGAA